MQTTCGFLVAGVVCPRHLNELAGKRDSHGHAIRCPFGHDHERERGLLLANMNVHMEYYERKLELSL